MAKLRIFVSFTVLLILTLLFVNCTEDSSPTTPSIDYIAPYVEWVNLSNSAELSGNVVLSFSVYDENGIDSVKIYINGALFVGEIPPRPPFKKGGKVTSNDVAPLCKGYIPEIAPPFSKGETPKSVSPFCKGGIKGGFYLISSPSDTTITIAWNTLDYEDGVYILEARAWDTSGNLGISPALMVNVKNETDPSEDHFPPMIVWVAPEASSEVSGDVTLRFNAMDNIGIDSLKLYINGVCPEGYTLQGQQEAEYSIVWTTEDFKDGVYILEARAWDTSGNMGTSPSLMVNVNNETDPSEDRLAPYVHWIAPEGGSTLKDTVSLQVGLFDENGIDSVKLYINGALFLGSADTSPSAIAGGEKGGVTLSVFKSTSAMNSCSIRKPPLYSPLLCRGDEHTNTDEVVSHFCKDENACTTSPFSKGGIKGGFNLANSSDTTITIAWNTLDYEDGVYILEARAWDTSGNLGISPSLMVNVKNDTDPPPEDRTPPVVSWVSPEPGTEVDGVVELQFDALDNTGIDLLKVYINGALPDGFTLAGQDNEERYTVLWHTEDYADGDYDVEVRAFDAAGNTGSAPAVSFTVLNNHPRVIWVPDDYKTIQGAINASEDADTVRVRAGTYYEGLRLMGKNIWLESEEGPEVTTIESHGWNDGIMIADNEEPPTTIRGFRIYNGYNGINIWTDVKVTIRNSIFDTFESHGINLNTSNSIIYNCLFVNCETGVKSWVSWGSIYNCMFIQCRIGIRSNAVTETDFDYGWNLFWENGEDYFNLEQSETDVFGNPLFVRGTYFIENNSPAIDAGKPDIIDPDGSISDIGIYGGPYAYPIPNN